MKLNDITKNTSPQVITEDLVYSQEFADLILNENKNGKFTEIDPDDLLAELQGYLDEIDRNAVEGRNG